MSNHSSSSTSAWINITAKPSSTPDIWTLVNTSRISTSNDLPPPWWTVDQPCPKCYNCGCPVHTAVWHAVFPGTCAWCHRGMFHLFQRYAGPSPGELQDRAERQWRADLLRFYKAVVEKRRMHGFQDRVQTPDADGVQEQALPVEKENVPKMRPDPERVQELREMRSWRPVAAVVQPVLSQSIEAVEKDIKSLTIAQLKPFLRAEGLAVSGTKAQMQERFMELINTRVQEGTVSEFNRLAFLVAHVKFRLNRIAGVTSDPPTRQDQHGPIAARLLQRHRQSLGNVTVLQ